MAPKAVLCELQLVYVDLDYKDSRSDAAEQESFPDKVSIETLTLSTDESEKNKISPHSA